MLEINNLQKTVGNKKILDGINLSFDFKNSVAIFGRHATGKSILLKSILGFSKFEIGTVIFNNKKVLYNSTRKINKLRESINLVSQEDRFLEDVTVLQNIQWITAKSHDQIIFIITEVGLSGNIDSKVKFISPKERQLLKLAIALLNSPKFLLVDEPMQNLTIEEAKDFVELLIRLTQKYTIGLLITTREKELICSFDQKYILENGILNEFTQQ